MKQVFVFVKVHALEGKHVNRYAARIDCLSSHAMPGTCNRHVQVSCLRPQQQLTELLFALLRITGNVPDLSHLCLVQTANVICIPCNTCFNDGPVPVGSPNEVEARRHYEEQRDSHSEHQEPLFFATGHSGT